MSGVNITRCTDGGSGSVGSSINDMCRHSNVNVCRCGGSVIMRCSGDVTGTGSVVGTGV